MIDDRIAKGRDAAESTRGSETWEWGMPLACSTLGWLLMTAAWTMVAKRIANNKASNGARILVKG